MAFNSFQYILFLILVIVTYWGLRRVRWQNLLLLASSYLFYGSWDWRFLSLILISTLVDYWVGRTLANTENHRQRQRLLGISIAVNLGLLGFFKYFNFFIDSAVSFLGGLGIQSNEFSLQVILPVGISFYTFQTLSYTIDIYQRKLEPTTNFLNFALFVAFFPQLVAGPIERASRLLPQLESRRSLNPEMFESGIILIFVGLFKKMLIADIAASLIEPEIFMNPASYSNGRVLTAVYLFALQIYGDFSGYSDIARGSARLLGIELMENFNQPYFSQTVSEFWRRWHISLSTWFRDYVYRPLNERIEQQFKNDWLQYALGVMITMLLSGLWHGANWTFVLWGGLLGVYQVISRPFYGKARFLMEHRLRLVRYLTGLVRILLTFHLILFAWVLFRTPQIQEVPTIFQQMILAFQLHGWSNRALQLLPSLVLLYGVIITFDLGQIMLKDHAFPRKLPVTIRTVMYIGTIFFMMFFSIKPYVPFIYFQF